MTIFSSPWGKVDYQSEHAPGIDFVTTSSHGGYHLSEERQAQFLACGAAFHAFGTRWLEEDCEAVLVYLAWPELATDEQLAAAEDCARMVASWGHSKQRWEPVVEWIDSPRRKAIRERAESHRESVKQLWERGGMGSMTPDGAPAEHWSVHFRRGEERQTVVMPYPQKRYYSDAEIAALAWTAEPVA